MFTFIAFLLTMLGCVNWLLVGLLQYDFIAGLFGFQASIFSRLCYILIGVGAMYLLLRVIVNKGTFKVFERRKKRRDAPSQTATASNQNAQIMQNNSFANANVEAGKEHVNDTYESQPQQNRDNLFDEHLNQN